MTGTVYGIAGMLVTVAAAIASDYVQDEAYWLIPACIVPCSIFGIWYAYSVITDRLPELVGLFNSFGGLAAALEGIAVYTDRTAVFSMYTGAPLTATEQKIQLVVLYFSIIIGMMTFTGACAPRLVPWIVAAAAGLSDCSWLCAFVLFIHCAKQSCCSPSSVPLIRLGSGGAQTDRRVVHRQLREKGR